MVRKTKIVATVGPASDSEAGLNDLLATGLDAVRFNMSQQNHTYYDNILKRIRDWESQNEGVGPAILVDLAGPKIRTVDFADGWELTDGAAVLLGCAGAVAPTEGIPLTGEFKFRGVKEGARISADDGRILLDVIASISNELLEVRVKRGGFLKPRKGVNFINIDLDVPAITAKDVADFEFALEKNVDWVALSFVRHADDIEPLQRIMNQHQKYIPILAKIEKPEALDALDEIVQAFDGVMVARGDLGVEVPLEQLPAIQKRIIRTANMAGKTVVIATQLLSTMQENPYPTRAEVTDVANAVYDGTDALLLTGETAIGKFPVETVQQMDRIISEVEIDPKVDPRMAVVIPQHTESDAIAHASGNIANLLDIRVIVTMTHSGATARAVSKYRPFATIYSLTPFLPVARQLKLTWGVQPIVVQPYANTDEMLALATEKLTALQAVAAGDRFVLSAGIPIGQSGTTNMLKIQVVDPVT
ncbi:MAG: pyruvate kinase [Lentisphaeria bacterium]|nr:pyruvate kinase [Candidatus Neomarinimicrobiota bacterium]MCF7841520.1 pyruvate kinase [Lentisphaeria bacterium]